MAKTEEGIEIVISILGPLAQQNFVLAHLPYNLSFAFISWENG